MRNRFLFILLFIANSGFAQIEKYIHGGDEKDSFGISNFYEFINKDSIRNIFLLSGSDHRFRSLDSARTILLNNIVRIKKPELIFYENTWENDLLLKEYYSGTFSLSAFPDSLLQRYNNTIAEDCNQVANSP